MAELAVSTWSLHRELGPMYRGLDPYAAARTPDLTYGPGTLDLLDAPALAATMGMRNLEICHFHFPRTDAAYLAELRQRLASAGVRFYTLLVDEGDITAQHPQERRRTLDLIRAWIDVAAAAGAQRVRVIAGRMAAAPDGAAVRRSIEGLLELVGYARERSVEVVTENWLELTREPKDLLAILDGAGGAVGLCADFGNYDGPAKYDDLAAILPRASSIHAKAAYTAPGVPHQADFDHCLQLARATGFDGAYVLIFDSPGDERANLMQLAELVRPYL